MTDVFDRAQARDAEMLRDALAKQQRRAHPDRPSALICAVCKERIDEQRRQAIPGVRTCSDCDGLCVECCGEIPEGRRDALPGVDTCVECQTALEGKR